MKKHYTIVGAVIVIAALLSLTSQLRITAKHAASVQPETPPNSSTGIPTGSTLSSIQESIARREYSITYDSAHHALQGPNRRHNLRAYYRPGNLTIQNRIDSAGRNFRMQLVNEGIYADGTLIATARPDAALDNDSDTLRITHKGFTEEFTNDEEGIRQNFIISEAPAHTRQLSVRLSVRGLHARQQSDDHLVFYSNDSGRKADRLTYSDLNCWDANGKPLTAGISISKGHIELHVNVSGAAYPVTIDPIVASGNPANADKTLEVNQTSAWMGFSVSTAGDVNGDGYSDVLVGAPKYDNGQADEGAAFLYPGYAGGISLAATVLECNQGNAQMGYSVSNAGDINKDGFSDIMVGAPYYDASASNEGAVFIYKGSAGGILANNPHVFKLDQAEANLGVSVAMAGDVNGDGYSDMLAGAHQFDHNQSNEGIGVVVLGAQNGLGLATFLECNQPGAMMGFAVAGAGDVDGDGFSDVMAGARLYSNGQALEGAAFIFKGSAGGVVTANPTVIESNQVDARLGHALSSAGDVNGDGFSDIAIGAYLYDKGSSNEGVVMIHYGSSNGISAASSQTLESDQIEAQFGISVACAGDVNGDGYADLIAGARYYDKGQLNEGAAFIYQGSKDGLHPMPLSVLESNQGDAWLGSAVAAAGDVNGDGFSDVLVGSYAFDHGQKDEGSMFVWYGQARKIDYQPDQTIFGADLNAWIGDAASFAGDVNSDGFSDLIIGSRLFDNGQPFEGAAFIFYGSKEGIDPTDSKILEQNQANAYFGSTVASAGDVNGDGFDDIIIGSKLFDHQETDDGAAFVYFGSAGGINTASTQVLSSNISNSGFGYAVAGAGDLNGDGFEDVVVGAPEYSNSENLEGAAYIYWGGPNGVNPFALILEGNHPFCAFGVDIDCMGDLNNDGYDDLVIGSFNYDQNGAAFIWYGAPGPSAEAILFAKSAQVDSHFGFYVSSIGDINGDGFIDIMIAAPQYDVGETNEGAVFIYNGSSSGLTSNPSIVLQCNRPYAYFGSSIASTGDINGDGVSDVIIGAPMFTNGEPEEGASFIYYGEESSNNQLVTKKLEFNNPYQWAGEIVSGTGDINGDGVNDLLVSLPGYDGNGMINSGAIYIYSVDALRNNLRLYNSADLTTPINHTQFPQNNFGAGLFAKSFTGRNKGKLIWETKPLAQGFSKGSNNRITNSTQSTGSQNVYSDLGATGVELKNVIDKQGPGTKVRVRVKYDPVLALTGQSYGPWRYLPAYLMGNSTAPVPENGASDMEERNASELATIYPNPVSNRLHIDFKDKEQVQNVKILTAAGSVAYQSNGFQPFVDVSKLSEGAYFLIITHTDGSYDAHQILIRR